MRLLHFLLPITGSILFLFSGISFAEPPAHAPAHGYRAKHGETDKYSSGVDLVYDSGRGVYVVVGLPEVIFHEGKFYKHEGREWEVSVRSDGGWRVAVAGSVPSDIEKIHMKSTPSDGKGKKRK